MVASESRALCFERRDLVGDRNAVALVRLQPLQLLDLALQVGDRLFEIEERSHLLLRGRGVPLVAWELRRKLAVTRSQVKRGHRAMRDRVRCHAALTDFVAMGNSAADHDCPLSCRSASLGLPTKFLRFLSTAVSEMIAGERP